MFQRIGSAASRYWPLMLVVWLAAVLGVQVVAPRWSDVVTDGEFSFLPPDVPSRRGEELFERAFSRDMLGSSAVIVARRDSGLLTLEDARSQPRPAYSDEEFIENILKPRIELIQHVTDLAALYSGSTRGSGPTRGGSEEERAAAYDEIHSRLSTIWKSAEEAGGEDSESRIRRRLELAETLTAVALDVAHDWHADLLRYQIPRAGSNVPDAESSTRDSHPSPGIPDDPDPETGVKTTLQQRIRRRLQQADVSPEQLSASWQRLLESPAGKDRKASRWKYDRLPAEGVLPPPIIHRVRTPNDSALGHLLTSKDGEAALIMIELRTEFLKKVNRQVIGRIERLVGSNDENGTLYDEELVPPGLGLALSGSAVVGRDMREAAAKSADATHVTTLLLVVALLLAIYRAPILVLIPLLTVFVSVELALDLLACLARAGYVELFAGIEVYSTVVMYGAGVDYCMFLIARYKEELDGGGSYEEAVSGSVGKVGSALAASAGTTMCGIGMMVFADFGKFRQAGVAMSFGLFFVLCAALTFAPALLRLFGRWAFWPQVRTERIPAGLGWVSPTSLVARLLRKNWFAGLWDRLGRALLARPGLIWMGCLAAMAPFCVVAVLFYNKLSYGLLSELPKGQTSVVGAKVVQEHFPPGLTSPVTILLDDGNLDFRRGEGREVVEQLAADLWEQRERLQIADIRSVADPFGISEAGRAHFAGFPIRERAQVRVQANKHYVSSEAGETAGHVTRIDVVFEDDPFSRNSIDRFERLKRAVTAALPEQIAPPLYVGATASIRDLKAVTNGDQVRIDVLVVASVFLVLVILLRKPAISAYLIVSVFFSYLVALGVTFAVFWALDPQGFAGLDWKVPMFLFTILIAVGEDYNIYLITRIEEEQQRVGSVKGVTVALSKTGKIISGCGIIMAGTFSSLLISGSLAGMRQLGFALAFGVLLDTFVVRPILVPAYLVLLHSGRFGIAGRFLGARQTEPAAIGVAQPLEVAGKEQKRSA